MQEFLNPNPLAPQGVASILHIPIIVRSNSIKRMRPPRCTRDAPNGIELPPIVQVVLHDHKSIRDFKRANRAKREEQ